MGPAARTVQQSFAAPLIGDLSLDDIRQVLGVFALDLDRLCDIMARSSAAADAPMFRRAAHGLSGAAGAVGAVRLSRICRDASERAREGGSLQASMATIDREAAPIRAELAEVLAWLEHQA